MVCWSLEFPVFWRRDTLGEWDFLPALECSMKILTLLGLDLQFLISTNISLSRCLESSKHNGFHQLPKFKRTIWTLCNYGYFVPHIPTISQTRFASSLSLHQCFPIPDSTKTIRAGKTIHAPHHTPMTASSRVIVLSQTSINITRLPDLYRPRSQKWQRSQSHRQKQGLRDRHKHEWPHAVAMQAALTGYFGHSSREKDTFDISWTFTAVWYVVCANLQRESITRNAPLDSDLQQPPPLQKARQHTSLTVSMRKGGRNLVMQGYS